MHGVSPARRLPLSAAAVLDVVASICVVAGNTLGGQIFPANWAIAGLSAAFLTGIALFIVRCIVWRSPSPLRTWWPRIVAAPGPTGRILALALASRAVVLAAGLIVALVYSDRIADAPRISTDVGVTLPARFDAFWYLDIARHGYHPPGREEPL